MGGEVSIDFKSSNRIEISRLVQVLLNFDWFRGSPLGGGWVGGCGWGMVRGCLPHTCTCTCMYTHACMHMHVWHHRESQVFPQWGQPFAWNDHVYHVRACMCMCVHMCGGTPNHPPPPSTHPPPPTIPHPHPPTPHPQSRREPKTPKFNKSWTNRDNSILFEDSLPLNIPELI